MKAGIIGNGAVGAVTAWLMKAGPEAVILIATNPPEPLIEITRHLSGLSFVRIAD